MKNNARIVVAVSLLSWSVTETAYAYVGPGAGFALLSSFFILLISFFLAFFYFFSWPLRITLKQLLGPRPKGKPQAKRVVVIGLDGMDPVLAERFLQEGKLPNFKKLKEQGTFARLATSYPSISPVAWSSFTTGVDPSHHNIYDFLTRDPCTYQPILSSAEIRKASKVLPLGKYSIPLNKPTIKLLQKSKPFWKILGENGIFSSILRVPITFPPEKFNGVLLSGMCTPDLRGSQGTFSYYTTNGSDQKGMTQGVAYHLTLDNLAAEFDLHGPENTFARNGGELKIRVKLKVDTEKSLVQFQLPDQTFELKPATYSPWINLTFRTGLGIKVCGICRFYVNRIAPDLEIYVTPIHINPEKPALPISHPSIYAVYMAKLIGPFGTLGLAEDTWALNERVIDEEAFLKQAYLFYDERKKMFFKALERTPKGLCACVFDTPDRIQHMFFRCLDKTHPANEGKEFEKYRKVIEELYVEMDGLVGQTLSGIDEKTVLVVMSDHGFTHFRRGVNLNTWFLRNGYLTLKNGKPTSGDWFENVDWEKTRAFSLGLTGIFINKKGRETSGIVEEGDEIESLKSELISKLEQLVDPETGTAAIRRVADTTKLYSGPYTYDAPDLLVGYAAGYRNSWDCAVGRVTPEVFENNTKSWSGDHCVDPEIVPGVLFCNRPIGAKDPHIKDIAPTVLGLFGVEPPSYMQGKSIL